MKIKKCDVLEIITGFIMGMIYLCFGGMILFNKITFGIICYVLGWCMVVIMFIKKKRKLTGEEKLELLNIINEKSGVKNEN